MNIVRGLAEKKAIAENGRSTIGTNGQCEYGKNTSYLFITTTAAINTTTTTYHHYYYVCL